MADYKTGIDLTFSGSAGTDYAVEQFYSTPQINDTKVTYIKDATSITMAYNDRHAGFYTCKSYPGVHNSGTFVDGETATQAGTGATIIIFGTQASGTLLFAQRTGGTGTTSQTGQFTGNTSGAKFTPSNGATNREYAVLGSTDAYGIIRYRIDRDLQWAGQFASGSPGELNPTYSAPFTFASLTYDGSTPVVGTTGDNGLTLNLANAATYYWRGMLDSVGDEWHQLTVGSDNTNHPLISSNYEYYAGDGRVNLFVVNPKTPCLSITVTGNAQFYTTPPKMYFIPKIRDQVTYFNAGSGTITFTLKDINGNNIFWRLNSGGAFTDAGSSTKTFTASDFANTGATPNTLEYYYAGNVAYTKTRLIYKNPAHPSLGETHGTLFRSPLDTWATVNARLAAAGPINDWYTTLETQESSNNRIAIEGYAYSGLRNVFSNVGINALDAVINSNWNSVPSGLTQTRGWFCKAALLDNCQTWDQVGLENEQHAGTVGDHMSLASRENIFRGYYDTRSMYDWAFLYDLVVANYRDDQNASGITAIENIKVRDDLARCVSEQIFVGQMASPNVYSSMHMWDTARFIAAQTIMYVIPTYSRPVYGTCGLDGNTTTYTYCPFPTDTLTWKKVLVDNNATLGSWPNYRFRSGVESVLFDPTGLYGDKQSYFNFNLMGTSLLTGINFAKINNPSLTWPHFDAGLLACANGTFYGTEASEGYLQLTEPTSYNSRFPLSAALGIAFTATQPTGDQSANSTMLSSQVFGLLYWDNPLVLPVSPPGRAQMSALLSRF